MASPDPVLVIGATGLLGAPVARQLRDDGHSVRVLVRDEARARTLLGQGFDYRTGSVGDDDAVDRAVEGCEAVHVSLAAPDRAELDVVEHQGTARVAAAAARHGLRRVSYLSGSLVHEDYGEPIPEHQAKRAAETAVRASGVPFTFFRPTYFMDTLPRHVQGRIAVLFGRQDRILHPVAAADYARMVSRALRTPEAAGQELYVHGPQALTLTDALRTYCAAVVPGTRVVTVPVAVMSAIDRVAMGGKLQGSLDILRLLARLGERGDPGPADALLGAPTTTVAEWCEARSSRPAAALDQPIGGFT